MPTHTTLPRAVSTAVWWSPQSSHIARCPANVAASFGSCTLGRGAIPSWPNVSHPPIPEQGGKRGAGVGEAGGRAMGRELDTLVVQLLVCGEGARVGAAARDMHHLHPSQRQHRPRLDTPELAHPSVFFLLCFVRRRLDQSEIVAADVGARRVEIADRALLYREVVAAGEEEVAVAVAVEVGVAGGGGGGGGPSAAPPVLPSRTATLAHRRSAPCLVRASRSLGGGTPRRLLPRSTKGRGGRRRRSPTCRRRGDG